MNIRQTAERMVFEVESAARPGSWYRVDLLENEGGGRCSCTDFGTRRQPAIDAGAPILTQRTLCKHIKAVAWEFLRTLLPAMAAQERE